MQGSSWRFYARARLRFEGRSQECPMVWLRPTIGQKGQQGASKVAQRDRGCKKFGKMLPMVRPQKWDCFGEPKTNIAEIMDWLWRQQDKRPNAIEGPQPSKAEHDVVSWWSVQQPLQQGSPAQRRLRLRLAWYADNGVNAHLSFLLFLWCRRSSPQFPPRGSEEIG